MKITDIRGRKVEVLSHTILGGVSEFGRSKVHILCPFCRWDVWAYKWSLAGCGKKCSCGALHSSLGTSSKLVRIPIKI